MCNCNALEKYCKCEVYFCKHFSDRTGMIACYVFESRLDFFVFISHVQLNKVVYGSILKSS